MSLHELIIAAQNFKRFIFLERSYFCLNAFSTLVFEFFHFVSFIQVFGLNANISFNLLTYRKGYWMFATRFGQVKTFI